MFRAHVLIIRRSKLHYIASVIITPTGGRLAHQTLVRQAQLCTTQILDINSMYCIHFDLRSSHQRAPFKN